MNETSKATAIVIGERYRRRNARARDYAWVTSYAYGSVGYQHAAGAASVPEEQFTRMFEAAPRRRKADN